MHLFHHRLSRPMRLIRLIRRTILPLTLAILSLTGCGSETGSAGERPPFAYLDSPAEFTAVFPPLDESAVPVSCRVSLSPEEIVFTVTEPERSRGLTVRYRDGRCTLEPPDGLPTALSPEASEPLTAFCRILTDRAQALKKPGDGVGAMAQSPDGVLLLSDEGIPRQVQSPAADGVWRTVAISGWQQQPLNNLTQ